MRLSMRPCKALLLVLLTVLAVKANETESNRKSSDDRLAGLPAHEKRPLSLDLMRSPVVSEDESWSQASHALISSADLAHDGKANGASRSLSMHQDQSGTSSDREWCKGQRSDWSLILARPESLSQPPDISSEAILATCSCEPRILSRHEAMGKEAAWKIARYRGAGEQCSEGQGDNFDVYFQDKVYQVPISYVSMMHLAYDSVRRYVKRPAKKRYKLRKVDPLLQRLKNDMLQRQGQLTPWQRAVVNAYERAKYLMSNRFRRNEAERRLRLHVRDLGQKAQCGRQLTSKVDFAQNKVFRGPTLKNASLPLAQAGIAPEDLAHIRNVRDLAESYPEPTDEEMRLVREDWRIRARLRNRLNSTIVLDSEDMFHLRDQATRRAVEKYVRFYRFKRRREAARPGTSFDDGLEDLPPPSILPETHVRSSPPRQLN